MASRQDPRPVYEQVAESLRQDIATGTLRPGAQLPSFREMQERFGISVTTAQRALRMLKDEGLVEGRAGEGTFVRPQRRLFVHSSSYVAPTESGNWAWGEEAAAQGMRGTQTMGKVREVPAPDMVADRLRIPEGGLVVLRSRTMLLDGDPVELVDSYYPADLALDTPLAQQKRIRGGSPAALAELGHAAVEYEERVRSRVPSPDEARSLGLVGGTPVLQIVRTLYDADDRPVEVCVMLLAADRVELRYRLPVHG